MTEILKAFGVICGFYVGFTVLKLGRKWLNHLVKGISPKD